MMWNWSIDWNDLLKCKTPVSSPSDDDICLEHAGIEQILVYAESHHTTHISCPQFLWTLNVLKMITKHILLMNYATKIGQNKLEMGKMYEIYLPY